MSTDGQPAYVPAPGQEDGRQQVYLMLYRRPAAEAPAEFRARLRTLADEVQAGGAATVSVYVDDGDVRAPAGAWRGFNVGADGLHPFDAAVVTTERAAGLWSSADVVYRADRRIMKHGPRPVDGERTPGFTLLCQVSRAPSLTLDEFDAHWGVRHAPIHVRWSPGTGHYEQLVIRDTLTTGAPPWDGVALVGFSSDSEYNDGLFDGPEGERAIREDVALFVDSSRSHDAPRNEYVVCDVLRPSPGPPG